MVFPPLESTAAAPELIEAPFCQRCGEPSLGSVAPELSYTCTDCEHLPGSFAQARSGYWAKGQVLEAIIHFKYHQGYHFRKNLVHWLIESYDRHAANQRWDALVPVPLYPLRQRERGFNQARELAEGLGQARQILVKDALYRSRNTISQTRLSRNKRKLNMKEGFELKQRFDVKGLDLLIIDDVFTTGSTTEACAQALAQAGAHRIHVLTIARS